MIFFQTKNSKVITLLFSLFIDSLKYKTKYLTIELLLLRLLKTDKKIAKNFFRILFSYTSYKTIDISSFCAFLETRVITESKKTKSLSTFQKVQLAPSLRNFLYLIILNHNTVFINKQTILKELMFNSKVHFLLKTFLISYKKSF